jgi:hypothetical protein
MSSNNPTALKFSRDLLRTLLVEVRKHVPNIHVAYVTKEAFLNQWEFHYKDFYWRGKADNAFDARYKGWTAYLDKLWVSRG